MIGVIFPSLHCRKSNSGKTTLIEKSWRSCRGGGFACDDQANRHGFEIDHGRKDSWRHKKAAPGPRSSLPGRVALIEDGRATYSLAELRDRYIGMQT